jgi:chemotaxis-related protein WspB
MLALLLRIGERRFAIPAASVLEVVPKVALRPAPEAEAYLAGLFAYRGTVLPAADLCMRVEGRACRSLLSSRIVVVRRSGAGPARAFGILSENVTDVRDFSGSQVVTVDADFAPYVRGTILQDGQMIHVLEVDGILPERTVQIARVERSD